MSICRAGWMRRHFMRQQKKAMLISLGAHKVLSPIHYPQSLPGWSSVRICIYPGKQLSGLNDIPTP